MQPKIELLSPELVQRILDEAFQLLMSPGVMVQSSEARHMLAEGGATVVEAENVVYIPEEMVRQALKTVPPEFVLYDRSGQPAITYGGNRVHFDPGSSSVNILDPDTLEHRLANTSDLVRLVKVAEMLDQYDAQSTAMVCNDVPKAIGDIYRLYLVLLHSVKPIITGAFSIETTQAMIDMLAIFTGGRHGLKEKPPAVFDVCPSPPMIWSDFGSQNLIILARAGVPAQIVSMPLAGAAGPVTLLGSVVQHAAETLSGITIHQLAQPGAPVVWGGAPAIFDMRKGNTPMGAIETAMIDAAYTQVGKYLSLPTHTYLGASDAKIVDAQAGLESGMTALVGALAGINMISGAGMLDFLACHSPEKLVVDAEVIGMAKRLVRGIQVQTETLATEMFADFGFEAEFLKQKITRRLFRKEQYIPSAVIDRGSIRSWTEEGRRDTFDRAKERVSQLLDAYQRPAMPPKQEGTLRRMMVRIAQSAGMEELPAT